MVGGVAAQHSTILTRSTAQIHVHGLYSDDNIKNQPCCLGYVRLNQDDVFLQPKQLNDKEGNPSKHIVYHPLVHHCSDPTSPTLRVMQGSLGIQLKPCEVPNAVNRQLAPPNTRLKVMIHDASNLARAVPFGFSNPFCKIFYQDKFIAKTVVETKTLNPVFREEQFLFNLPYDDAYYQRTGKREKVYEMKLELRVEIWSRAKKKFGADGAFDDDGADDKFLGQVTLTGREMR